MASRITDAELIVSKIDLQATFTGMTGQALEQGYPGYSKIKSDMKN